MENAEGRREVAWRAIITCKAKLLNHFDLGFQVLFLQLKRIDFGVTKVKLSLSIWKTMLSLYL